MPGERLIDYPHAIATAYACHQKQHPFVLIEENQVIPNRLYPGEEFNHRFTYVMCPSKTAGVITGALHRRIYFKGKVVFKDTSNYFEIKPGKWSVDAFIKIPLKAAPGVYSLALWFYDYKDEISLSEIQHLMVLKR